MRAKKPIIYHNDNNVNETFDSISWAEKEYGQRLVLPKKTDFELHNNHLNGTPEFNYEEDEDVSSTLDSIKDAE